METTLEQIKNLIAEKLIGYNEGYRYSSDDLAICEIERMPFFTHYTFESWSTNLNGSTKTIIVRVENDGDIMEFKNTFKSLDEVANEIKTTEW